MSRVYAVSILAAVATAATFGSLISRPSVVATVDGAAISREAHDEYARVFTAPDGSLRVSEADVLLSLVNQVLVQREADRRGLAVADQDVSHAIEDMQHMAAVTLSLPGVADETAFRERVKMFQLFRLVKSAVVGQVEIPPGVLEAEYSADPGLHIIGLSDAIPVIRERLVNRESDRRWADWLSSQRACADIRIFDLSLNVPSSTPGPECRAATDW